MTAGKRQVERKVMLFFSSFEMVDNSSWVICVEEKNFSSTFLDYLGGLWIKLTWDNLEREKRLFTHAMLIYAGGLDDE